MGPWGEFHLSPFIARRIFSWSLSVPALLIPRAATMIGLQPRETESLGSSPYLARYAFTSFWDSSSLNTGAQETVITAPSMRGPTRLARSLLKKLTLEERYFPFSMARSSICWRTMALAGQRTLT